MTLFVGGGVVDLVARVRLPAEFRAARLTRGPVVLHSGDARLDRVLGAARDAEHTRIATHRLCERGRLS